MKYVRDDITKEIDHIDARIDIHDATDYYRFKRVKLLKQLEEIETTQNIDITQKAKIKWDVEWDENYKFFHGILKKTR